MSAHEPAATSVKATRNGLRRPSWSASAPARGIATSRNRTTTNCVIATYQSGLPRSSMTHVPK